MRNRFYRSCAPPAFPIARRLKDLPGFSGLAKTNRFHVPAVALAAQGVWAALLVLPRTVTYNPQSTAPVFGNVYTQLLEYIVSVELVFGASTELKRILSHGVLWTHGVCQARAVLA